MTSAPRRLTPERTTALDDDDQRVRDFRRACDDTLPYGLTADDDSVVALLREIGGEPAAMTLAALLLRARPPADIIRALRQADDDAAVDGPLGRLVEGGRARFAHAGDDARAWTVLGVFHDRFDLATAVAALRACAVADPEERLGALVAEGIVVRTGRSAGILFSLPSVYRLPAAAALRADPALRRDALDALVDHWLLRTSEGRALWWAPRQSARIEEAEVAVDDLTTIIEERRPDRPHDVLRLVTQLLPFWLASSRVELARRYLLDGLADPDLPDDVYDDAVYTLAWVSSGPRDAVLVDDLLHGRRAARSRDQARLDQVRGMSAMYAGDPTRAREDLTRAITQHSEAANEEQLVLDLSLISCAHSLLGDHAAAFDASEEAVALCERHGATMQRNYALWSFALSAWREGDHHRAYVLAQEGIAVADSLGDRFIGAICIEVVAWYEAAHADPLLAARLIGAADGLRVEVGLPILLWSTDQPHAECIAAAERALGPGRFWAAVREARGSTLSTALTWLAAPTAPDETVSLTSRQREIADLIARGHTNKEIARLLLITVSTVETHVENIFAKLGVVSRAQVAAWSAARAPGLDRRRRTSGTSPSAPRADDDDHGRGHSPHR